MPKNKTINKNDYPWDMNIVVECMFCLKESDLRRMRIHLLKYHQSFIMQKCYLCDGDNFFNQASDIQKHLRDEHLMGNNKRRCPIYSRDDTNKCIEDKMIDRALISI